MELLKTRTSICCRVTERSAVPSRGKTYTPFERRMRIKLAKSSYLHPGLMFGIGYIAFIQTFIACTPIRLQGATAFRHTELFNVRVCNARCFSVVAVQGARTRGWTGNPVLYFLCSLHHLLSASMMQLLFIDTSVLTNETSSLADRLYCFGIDGEGRINDWLFEDGTCRKVGCECGTITHCVNA